ncbi:MAG: hypothetical protein U0836_17430 [Pirellulales bacterium]
MTLHDADEPLLPDHELDPQDLRCRLRDPSSARPSPPRQHSMHAPPSARRRWGRGAVRLTYAAGVLTVLAFLVELDDGRGVKQSEQVAAAPSPAAAKTTPPELAAAYKKEPNSTALDERRLSPGN